MHVKFLFDGAMARASVNECEEMLLSKAACWGHVECGNHSVAAFRKKGKKA
jgi:hypothetical protein